MSRDRMEDLAAGMVQGLMAALIVLLVIFTFLQDTFNPLFLSQLLPLGILIPGLRAKNSRAFKWLCFLVLFFLMQGILLAFTRRWRLVGIIETFICVAAFFSAIIFIRINRGADQGYHSPD